MSSTPENEPQRKKREFTPYQKSIIAQFPKREDYVSEDEYQEARAGFIHRTSHILGPRPEARSSDEGKDSE